MRALKLERIAKKLTYDELFNSTTMFYVNDNCEKFIRKEIDDQTKNILTELKSITSKESLKRYIIANKDSLKTLISVAEISAERFKRIVSMIRKDKGYVFATEWDLIRIRSVMMENPVMMDSILNLIWNGKNDPKMQSCVPSFYLENMVMDSSTIAKLQNETNVRQLVKRCCEGSYSNMIGDAVLSDVENELKKACMNHGLEYQKNVRIPKLDRTVSFVLESSKNPKLILDVSYCVTTSSSQGSKKEDARKTESIIKAECKSGNNIIYVNFLDGAGWIGRQADLREIYRCSDYVVNLKNINLLKDIINTHVDDLK